MTDIVERLRFASACAMSVGEEIGRHLVDEAADEIARLRSDVTDLMTAANEAMAEAESLRLQLSLQKEKLPSAQSIPGVSQTDRGPLWSGDWRDYPEAP